MLLPYFFILQLLYELILSLKNKKSFRIDGISNIKMKGLKNEIATPLSILINDPCCEWTHPQAT